MHLTNAQRELLEDKFVLWERSSRQGPMDMRDYNARAAEALKVALSIVSDSTPAPSDGWMQEVVDGFEKLIEFVEREELHDEGAFDVECEVCLALEAARKTLLRLRGAS